MKCFVCESEDIQEMEVMEELVLDNDRYLYPMTLHVCVSCGERYYPKGAVDKLHALKNQLKRADKGLGKIKVGGVYRVTELAK